MTLGRRARLTDTAPTARVKLLLPLYDVTAPVVCTISPEDKADRIAVMNRMRAATTSIERTHIGLLLHFPREAALEAAVRRFALDEKRCCQFWGFAVVADDDELVLRWDGPPTAGPLLDTLESVLRSGDPIESIEGLL